MKKHIINTLLLIACFFLISQELFANPIALEVIIYDYSVVPISLGLEVLIIAFLIRNIIQNQAKFISYWFVLNIISFLSLLLFVIVGHNIEISDVSDAIQTIKPNWLIILAGELLVVFFEGVFLYSFVNNEYFGVKENGTISFRKAQAYSLVGNFVSFSFPYIFWKFFIR